ncbi:hypothetical protein BZL30_5924 [Mycobacterium kansasii]|uniref:Uncharacterized protein n=1 Tax=Mycobacterium kansasii TaxID=1768 RepID=A0A1V3WXQ7_MYCKA|nr:hypothetical protein BZL30_5924 [Mycobacterium kansasii]
MVRPGADAGNAWFGSFFTVSTRISGQYERELSPGGAAQPAKPPASPSGPPRAVRPSIPPLSRGVAFRRRDVGARF